MLRSVRFVLVALLLGDAPAMAAGRESGPLRAEDLPPALLADCDARAAPHGSYESAIAASVAALTRLGVFSAAEFSGVRIGFCAIRKANGPVAATACASDIILLDEKYRDGAQALVLNATLAHEMKHYFQHRARRERYGAGYCDSAHYVADLPELEAAADAFGDAVGELFALGRPIEIDNRCADPVDVYVEPVDPASVAEGALQMIRVPANTATVAPSRALSSNVYFYAETLPSAQMKFVFENRSSPHRRFIDGRQYRLRETGLPAAGREAGPFRLVLSCRAGS